jgi:hypothetical protein
VPGADNQLKSLTDDATFLGKKATTAEANLLFKLDEANDKLVEGKYQDAIDKLTDFQNTVIALDEGDKIDPDDASELIAAAEEAKDCVDGLRLQAQATTAA